MSNTVCFKKFLVKSKTKALKTILMVQQNIGIFLNYILHYHIFRYLNFLYIFLLGIIVKISSSQIFFLAVLWLSKKLPP
jgi:hypothetical protein